MEIQVESGQIGVIGDFVQSNLKEKGHKHFVTPRFNTTGQKDYEMLWKASLLAPKVGGRPRLLPRPEVMFATHVTLKATDALDFGTKFKWENAKAVRGTPEIARVSRTLPRHFPVRIKRRRDGAVVAELDVWVVASSITTPKSVPDRTVIYKPSKDFPLGAFGLQMGFRFVHTIAPRTIITAKDRPDLTGRNSTFPPQGRNYDGRDLQTGADRKWDVTRVVRQRVLNPSHVDLDGSPSAFGDFLSFPTMGDGDGAPRGAGSITFGEWLIAGNDDVDDFVGFSWGDVNPYDKKGDGIDKVQGVSVGDTASELGTLTSFDMPGNLIGNDKGSDGDTLEWRMHFQEFTRLEINRKWYLISERLAWRVHQKLIKVKGKWENDGSEKKLDNRNF